MIAYGYILGEWIIILTTTQEVWEINNDVCVNQIMCSYRCLPLGVSVPL